MTNPSIVKSCNLLIAPHTFLPAVIEIGESKTLRISIPISFSNFPSIYQAIYAKIDAIFSDSVMSNVFVEKLNPAHLNDENLFKATPLIPENPLRAIYPPMIGGRASPLPIDPEEDYLFTVNFNLGFYSIFSQEDLLSRIRRLWISLNTPSNYDSPSQLTRQLAISVSPESLPPSISDELSLLIGDLPFTISLDKIKNCLNTIISPYIHNIPYQSDPLIYPFAVPIAAGAASSETFSTPAAAAAAGAAATCDEKPTVSGSKRSFSAMSNALKPIISITAAARSETPIFSEISEEESLLNEDAVAGTAQKPAVLLFSPISSCPATARSETPIFSEISEEELLAKKAAKKRTYDSLAYLHKEALTNLKPTSSLPISIPFPLLELTRKECLSIFTRNIPDIARSMLVGVLEAHNPNEASLIRMQLFINLFIINQPRTDPNSFFQLIHAIEEAISGLTDHEKAWARAKFVSLVFLSSNFSLPQHDFDSTILEDNSIYLKSVIDSDSASKKETYIHAVKKVLHQMTSLRIISPLVPLLNLSQSSAWERRKHFVLAIKRSALLRQAAGAASTVDTKEGLSPKRFRKDA